MAVPIARIEEARRHLRAHLAPTPLVRASGAHCAAGHLFLKNETGLPTGSFKVRGAIYALAVNAGRRAIQEAIAASTGNHGAAVAYAGRLLNVPVTIFVPERPNPVKAQRIRELGAGIVEAGADLSAAIDAAYEYASKTGAFFLHDASDPDVPAGAGTIALEMLEQLPAVETIYVPMGDTALIRGVASAAKQRKPTVRIVGAAAAGAPAYYQSFRERSAVETPTAITIADGLAVRRALAPNVDAIRALVDEVRLVSDDEMLRAMVALDRREGIVAEPAGAAAMAAYLQAPARSGISVALVTGGNVAPDVRAQVLAM
jgi:threonine dehydratase